MGIVRVRSSAGLKTRVVAGKVGHRLKMQFVPREIYRVARRTIHYGVATGTIHFIRRDNRGHPQSVRVLHPATIEMKILLEDVAALIDSVKTDDR